MLEILLISAGAVLETLFIMRSYKRRDASSVVLKTMGVGCEAMLRTGSGVCVAASTPGLIDETSGTALAGGLALQQNHLYMATVDSRGVQASANSTKLLVRGNYSVQ